MKKIGIIFVFLIVFCFIYSISFSMNKAFSKLNGQIISLFDGNDDSYAVVKTLTSTSQNVFASVLEQDEIVRFWAEEDFSYTVSANPTASISTSHRIPAYAIAVIVVSSGTNIAIVGTDNSKKFYLSK